MRADILNFNHPEPVYRDKREAGTGGGTGIFIFCGMMLLAMLALAVWPMFLF
jgi:hypothetical protein